MNKKVIDYTYGNNRNDDQIPACIYKIRNSIK